MSTYTKMTMRYDMWMTPVHVVTKFWSYQSYYVCISYIRMWNGEATQLLKFIATSI